MTDRVVQIVAPEAVLYSLDRGFTMNEFEPGEFYAVPDFVAEAMIRRGWAKLASPKEALSTPQEPAEVIEASAPAEATEASPPEDHKAGKKRSK